MQAEVDRLCASGRRAARALPRDLAEETLAEVRGDARRGRVRCRPRRWRRCAGVSRVTARRYLEYLLAAGEVTVHSVADGPGRPVKAYVSSARV